jgi:plasmid stabilization system protein ParE
VNYRFTERARIEIDFHDHWWQNHRPAAPTLFLEELLKAIQQAVEQPRLARVYDKNKRPNVRYIPLPKTRSTLYYAVEPDEVIFLGVWGGHRGPRPQY